MQGFCGVERVFQQAGAGHRANAARYRSNPAGAGQGGFVDNVTDQFAVVLTVDADVDHDRAFLDPLALDQARFAGGDDHQISTADVTGQILGEA